MLQEIIMPKLGDTMEEGAILSWKISQGDQVKKGQIIFEVETDKATLEVESLVQGQVLRIDVQEGQNVPVGTVLGYVGSDGDEIPERKLQPKPAKAEQEEESNVEVTAKTITQATDQGQNRRPPVAPRAKRLAEKLGVDIKKVSGRGPRGRITSKDVQDFYDRKVAASLEIGDSQENGSG